eukprot:COSAG02_NODE_57891_length_279_cov_0.577778_1_plen_35_part_01
MRLLAKALAATRAYAHTQGSQLPLLRDVVPVPNST